MLSFEQHANFTLYDGRFMNFGRQKVCTVFIYTIGVNIDSSLFPSSDA